jgi:hypothetical protein
LLFFFAGYRADAAMDKAGIGNLSQWTYWHNMCGQSIFILLILWLCSVIVTMRTNYQSGARGIRIVHTKMNALQSLAVGGPIVMIIIGYLLYFVRF